MLLEHLDTNVGKDNYTIFLTVDHAVVQVPSYLHDLKIPVGYFHWKDFRKEVNSITQKHFDSSELIENISNYQIFLNKEKMSALALNQHKAVQTIIHNI